MLNAMIRTSKHMSSACDDVRAVACHQTNQQPGYHSASRRRAIAAKRRAGAGSMTNGGESRTWPELNDEVLECWNTNAVFWDSNMGEGNAFHLQLVGPAVERLLAIRSGERVIDIACGNGQFSRRLGELGATVRAFDIAPGMIETA